MCPLLGFGPLGGGLKWFRLHLAAAIQKNFDFAFCVFQLLTAGVRQLNALFKKAKRFLERDFALFKFADNLLQTLQAFFKLRQVPRSVLCILTENLSR